MDERALVTAIQNGDQQAFAELVHRYEGKIYNLALRLMKSPEEAEEILQETFLAAFRAIHSFRAESGLHTWLYRIATNAALMRLRRQRNVASLDELMAQDTEEEPQPLQLVDWQPQPEEAALTAETRAMLEAALQRLPEAMRVVVLLRDVQGLSTDEVAEVLGLSVPAVKSRLHRGRLALRQQLADYFHDRRAIGAWQD